MSCRQGPDFQACSGCSIVIDIRLVGELEAATLATLRDKADENMFYLSILKEVSLVVS